MDSNKITKPRLKTPAKTTAPLLWACTAPGFAAGRLLSERPASIPLVQATQGSPTVADVYHGRIGQTPQPVRPDPQTLLAERGGARAIGSGDELTQRYWSALEPMNQRFQRVPNPDLVMVVYPHLAKGKYPVPGYVTTFPLYDEVHYALPGEVPNELAQAQRLHIPDTPQVNPLPNTSVHYQQPRKALRNAHA